MSWFVPYQKLDAQQKDFVDNRNVDARNVWIKGFPGSGKSTLLAHTIIKIRDKNPQASIAVVVFTRSLITMFEAGLGENGVRVPIMNFYDFMKTGQKFDYVLCDEVQDLTSRVLSEMNKRAKHIIVAGDENQSIYDVDPQYREPTVSSQDIKGLISADEYELTFIHRLTRNIISIVQKFMPRINIFAAKQDLSKRSTQVVIGRADNLVEEVAYIMREAEKSIRAGETAAILLPKQDMVVSFVNQALENAGKGRWEEIEDRWGKPNWGYMNKWLSRNNVRLQYVGNGYGTFSDNSRLITLMTYHSSKGLDFDNVFMPFVNGSLYIARDADLSRRLFMVAMTRSKNRLYFTYNGYPSSYLDLFKGECALVDIHDVLNPSRTESKGTGNIFGI